MIKKIKNKTSGEEKDEREKTMAGYYNLGQDFLFLIGRSEDEINSIFFQILWVSFWHRPLQFYWL